jgi:hypothetical protein
MASNESDRNVRSVLHHRKQIEFAVVHHCVGGAKGDHIIHVVATCSTWRRERRGGGGGGGGGSKGVRRATKRGGSLIATKLVRYAPPPPMSVSMISFTGVRCAGARHANMTREVMGIMASRYFQV